jgi:hypothetical protein
MCTVTILFFFPNNYTIEFKGYWYHCFRISTLRIFKYYVTLNKTFTLGNRATVHVDRIFSRVSVACKGVVIIYREGHWQMGWGT